MDKKCDFDGGCPTGCVKGKYGFNDLNGDGKTNEYPTCRKTCVHPSYTAEKCKGCNSYNGKCGAWGSSADEKNSPPSIENGNPVCSASNDMCNPGCETNWKGENCATAAFFMYDSVTADEYVTLL